MRLLLFRACGPMYNVSYNTPSYAEKTTPVQGKTTPVQGKRKENSQTERPMKEITGKTLQTAHPLCVNNLKTIYVNVGIHR